MNLNGNTPLDYRALWLALKVRLAELATEKAIRCATESEEREVRKLQGGFSACHDMVAEMDRLVDEARGPNPDTRYTDLDA